MKTTTLAQLASLLGSCSLSLACSSPGTSAAEQDDDPSTTADVTAPIGNAPTTGGTTGSNNLPVGSGGTGTSSGGAAGGDVTTGGTGGLPLGGNSGGSTGSGGAAPVAGDTCVFPESFDALYAPTGWMGDQGALVMSDVCESRADDAVGSCQEVVLTAANADATGWSGVYWQYPANNWGEAAGCDLSAGAVVRFMARGAEGGEVVEFGAQGVTPQPVTLTDEWTEYEVDLSASGESANIWGAFSFSLTTGADATFYLDDMRISAE